MGFSKPGLPLDTRLAQCERSSDSSIRLAHPAGHAETGAWVNGEITPIENKCRLLRNVIFLMPVPCVCGLLFSNVISSFLCLCAIH